MPVVISAILLFVNLLFLLFLRGFKSCPDNLAGVARFQRASGCNVKKKQNKKSQKCYFGGDYHYSTSGFFKLAYYLG